ncbi:hypothetical protein ACH518_21060 [Methylomonas sp. HW2-6]|uniref:hypothetical protein n=1 Tax=Methylomonas sp. HW2-6 TaxID=3376687 RepID=UPI004042B066
MSQTWTIIILANLFAVSVLGLAVLWLVGRREKKRHQAEIEALLAEIEDRQGQRADRILLALVEKYGFGEEAGHSVSEVLMLAEKQFLYQCVEQLLGRQPLSGFYESLCGLLDSYLNATLTAKPVAPPIAEPADGDAEPAGGDGDAEPAEAGAEQTETPPPDWGDVFD